MRTTTVSKSVIAALLSNVCVTILKFIGYCLTQSPSMMAEAAHSAADTANQLMLLIGEKTSSLESTANYKWGKGTLLYLFNFISAIGVFLIGCVITVRHSLDSLANPGQIPTNSLFLIGAGILVASFLIEGYSLKIVIAEINKIRGNQAFMKFVFRGSNPTLSAVFLEDLIAVIGVSLALCGQAAAQVLKSTYPDSVVGLVIGIILGFVALFLGIINAQLLIGRSIDVEDEEKIISFIESFPLIEKVYNFKSEILKPGAISIMVEVEIEGSGLLSDNEHNEGQLDRDAQAIHELMLDNVDEIAGLKRILMKIYGRSNRMFGKEIDRIEKAVKTEFPEIVSINFEIK